MRCQTFLLSLLLLALRVDAAPLQERQDGLGALGSLVSNIINPDPTPPAAAAPTGVAAPTTTSKTKKNKHETETETSSVLVGAAVTATSTPESSSPTSTSSSEIITSTSSATSSSSISTSSSPSSSSSPSTTSTASSIVPTPPTPTQTANRAATKPTSTSSHSGNSMTTAGIAVAVLLSVAILVTVFVCIWKFCGPVKRWREKREYEKMQERTYRPALDGPMAGKADGNGLGLSNIEQERPLSFLALVKPKSNGIKRKTIGSGPRGFGGTGKSPLISETASTVSSRIEKGLPALPGHGPRQAALS